MKKLLILSSLLYSNAAWAVPACDNSAAQAQLGKLLSKPFQERNDANRMGLTGDWQSPGIYRSSEERAKLSALLAQDWEIEIQFVHTAQLSAYGNKLECYAEAKIVNYQERSQEELPQLPIGYTLTETLEGKTIILSEDITEQLGELQKALWARNLLSDESMQGISEQLDELME